MPQPMDLHRHTPTVRAIDPRGLPVLSVDYWRQRLGGVVESRPARQAYDAARLMRARWDPRLWNDGGTGCEPNQSTAYSLTGQSLRSRNADAGWHIRLLDDAGQASEAWDGRGTHRWSDYDEQLRQIGVTERMDAGPVRCVERFTYGSSAEGVTNRCGRIIRHDDPAGSNAASGYALSGGTLAATRRFLADLATPDWPAAIADRDVLLETGADGTAASYTTCWQYDALDAPRRQTDVAGHARISYLDVAGQLLRVEFKPSGGAASSVIRNMTYDVFGRAATETAGNGVETQTSCSVVDGRLRHRTTARSGQLLQDVEYTYDPVGNVTRVVDRAQPTAWFDGKRVDPESAYAYDTLYQLIEATGRESAWASAGPALPGLVLPGAGAHQRRTYVEAYVYDRGGNLSMLSHAASDLTQYTRKMAVATCSNRSLYQPDDVPPDFRTGFDANGNQQALDGPTMAWDARNQLQRVTQVFRAEGANDEETYAYDGGGMRRRKVQSMQVGATVHVREVRYLPGLALHRDTATGEVWEVVSLVAGCSSVRWLRWTANGRSDLPPPQWRYSIDDHLGSSTLELDENANVISHEGYYPYGGTAWWAARSEVDAKYKTIRYSRKECDAGGLYYYGYRYYAPWLCRWINPDPAGDVDGLNRYAFVGCNPVTRTDASGLIGEDADPEESVGRVEDVSTFLRGIWAPLWTDEPNRRAVELLNQSLRLAGRIATRAVRNLREGTPPVRQRIDNSLAQIFRLGEDTPEGAGGFADIRHWAAGQLRPIARSLNRRLRPGNDGIVWYSSTGAIAQVVRTDPRERIFVNLSTVEAHDRSTLAEILIHEESHFLSRSDTSDVRYLTATREQDRRAPHRRIADVMQRYKSSLEEANAYDAPDESADESRAELAVMRDHFGGVAAYFDAPDEERRMGMLMHNADTLAVIAMISGAEAIVDWDRRAPPTRRIRGPGQAPHPAQRP